jgi:hypothetical protein
MHSLQTGLQRWCLNPVHSAPSQLLETIVKERRVEATRLLDRKHRRFSGTLAKTQ